MADSKAPDSNDLNENNFSSDDKLDAVDELKEKSIETDEKSMEENLKDEPDTEEEYRGTFPIAGIGASAGGLEALEVFFRNMPSDSGMAFVVVQHLSPDYKSLMLELLSKHTGMEIFRVEDGMKMKPNSIYLIPPKKNMTIFHGKLFLDEQTHDHGLNLPIDIFFRSLAEDTGERSIGIVLSGTGSDGTLGIRAIKGAGGVVMVQDESTAKFDGMPRSAISTGMVDYILPPEKMPEQLVNYAMHPFVSKMQREDKALKEDEDTMTKILALLRTRVGTDFTFYKPNTIIRRIEKRISVNQIDSIENYLSFINRSPNEAKILYKELLIGVTKFFRDGEAYDIIEKKVIPKIFEKKSPSDPIRVWTVGCSTGEESYSLAILFREQMEKIGKNYDVKIFATDIDKDAVEYASAGIYPDSIIADVSPERLKRYFKKSNNSYKVNEAIRQSVIFATHNILKDPPFSKIDLISCRNLMIYFQSIMQKKVLSAFRFSLNKNGYLFLGASETVGDLSQFFKVIDNKWKIYQNRDGGKSGVIQDFYVPNIPKAAALPTRAERDKAEVHSDSYIGKIRKKLEKDYLPASAIIDSDYKLIHVFSDITKFLKVPQGKIDLNVLNMAHADISIALSTAIHKAVKEKKEIVYKDLTIRQEDENLSLNLIVRPIDEVSGAPSAAMVIFEEIPTKEPITEAFEEYDRDTKVSQRMEDLEQELKYTKESLQASIEELETSNEELQATNEELIASNEELQSTNEELQSVNEELYTVNSEYQSKIEELTELNNDINNWFSITEIGTIFLDLNLRIRKYSTGIEKIINLIENDIGRPVNHISYNFDYPEFFDDIEIVLKDLKPIEKEVKSKDEKKWFLAKILPYRTIENAVKGVALTFIDISELKQAEKSVERERDLLIRVLENSPVGKTIVDKNGDITFVNKRAEVLLGVSREEAAKRKYNSPEWNSETDEGDKMQDDNKPYAKIMTSHKPIYNHLENIERPDGSRITLHINGAPIFDENGEVNGAVFALEDYDKLKLLSEKKNSDTGSTK